MGYTATRGFKPRSAYEKKQWNMQKKPEEDD
jgi:hypothetical protein